MSAGLAISAAVALALAALAQGEHIYKAERFSDHAPITVGYGLSL